MDSLYGILFSKWIKLLAQNNFRISLGRLKSLIVITILSVRNSYYARLDRKVEKNELKDFVMDEDPVFILGHWRSGTTFLHNLISLDKSFAFPRIYQVIHPNTFLYLDKKFRNFIETRNTKKRNMDNVKHHPMLPGEEEFGIAAITLKSPIVGWVFPSRYDYYEKFLCLNEINEADYNEWSREYSAYLKKIYYLEKKQLVLKSPTNTARIKFLLELFPNAKFIHIHRNPFNVFLSTRKLHQTAIKKTQLQMVDYDVEERILNTYDKLYNCFFNDKDLLNDNNFVDVSFEELERDTIGTIKKIYESVNIGDFDNIKPELEKYLEENKDYKKNKYKELSNELKEKIYTRWKKYFDYWGYENK